MNSKIKCIWIIGPMGSGKSSLCRKLKTKLSSEFVHLDIDKLREVCIKDNEPRNDLAQKIMKRKLKYSKFILLESVGTWSPFPRFNRDEVIIIKLNCSLENSVSRVTKRWENNFNTVLAIFKQSKEEAVYDLNDTVRALYYWKRILPDYKIDSNILTEDEVFLKTIEILKL